MVSSRDAADPPRFDGRRCETPNWEIYHVREEDHEDDRRQETRRQQANPIGEDGIVRIDEEAMERRRAAQVRLLLRTGPFAMIVLGGANDLSSHVDRLSGGTAEYIRVEVQAWSEHAADMVPHHTDAADEESMK